MCLPDTLVQIQLQIIQCLQICCEGFHLTRMYRLPSLVKYYIKKVKNLNIQIDELSRSVHIV